MVRPQPDPVTDAPPTVEVNRVAARLGQLRTGLLGLAPVDPAALARFGLAVLDQFELRPSDVTPSGGGQDAVRPAVEAAGRRFLEYVLPSADEWGQLGQVALAEYAGIDPDRPDPGRLAAAFGVARLRQFAADRRLVYRTGGYRGRPGAPLADHLLSVVLPAPASPGSVG